MDKENVKYVFHDVCDILLYIYRNRYFLSSLVLALSLQSFQNNTFCLITGNKKNVQNYIKVKTFFLRLPLESERLYFHVPGGAMPPESQYRSE